MRDATKDKSYRQYEMGQEAGRYLRWKRGALTEASYISYETCLDKLARHFPDLQMRDFEPPVGTERLEEFLDHYWGDKAPATYNQRLGTISDFFKWARIKGKLHGDPVLGINRRKKRGAQRETFSEEDVEKILAAQDGDGDTVLAIRDRCCLRLLLHYGIRKGALRNLQLKHFDHTRRRVTLHTKGGKVYAVPVPEPEFWTDLSSVKLGWQLKDDDYLLGRARQVPRLSEDKLEYESRWTFQHDKQISNNGAHIWWYRCLNRAGIVDKDVRKGKRMHGARHTAAQRVLDKTKGNIVATQKLLGHTDPATTMKTYVDWGIDQLEATMADVFEVDS